MLLYILYIHMLFYCILKQLVQVQYNRLRKRGALIKKPFTLYVPNGFNKKFNNVTVYVRSVQFTVRWPDFLY